MTSAGDTMLDKEFDALQKAYSKSAGRIKKSDPKNAWNPMLSPLESFIKEALNLDSSLDHLSIKNLLEKSSTGVALSTRMDDFSYSHILLKSANSSDDFKAQYNIHKSIVVITSQRQSYMKGWMIYLIS